MFRKETYVRRRSELRKRIEGGLVLLPGNGESPANYPSNQFRFRQDSTFLYFFGLNRPDYVGLIDIDSGEETLYGDDYTIDDIIWMGPQPTLGEQAREVGIGKTLPLSQLGKRIKRPSPRSQGPFSCPYRGETTLQIARLLGLAPERVPLYASVELAKAVVALREIKDADEIDQIEKACEIGSKMHCMAMKMCRPGVVEREIAGAIESIALRSRRVVLLDRQPARRDTAQPLPRGHAAQRRLMLVDAGARRR
ncbi:MAG: aminopeptidase P N-terminal domain-containing protein [Alistipes sp.]